ncbi:rhodanese-like domain-containing protein 4, chloroplastic isoform X2 [Syzygium oleosum]|uniref:rhodanese-like domain-containing protein 4, chloroplastic isoform X1 n=1 Tax=Syzygium oleosum TaxID=219896 RepID=UPI0024BA3AC3|nr:rhodanese-like domain-containing protein 4, chloroplastic isoform X1 [Syzygium oleosum]XP_056160456.1 rhodanese-like domain-containing protein 4, chloroplastic isoform X2 [Syzygium oleosum]
MEALKAAGLTPISVLCDRKREPRKVLSLPSNSPLKLSNSSSSSNTSPNFQEPVSWGFHGGLVLASSLINTGLAKALTYEEALQQSVSTSAPEGGLDFDARGVLDNVISFATENPAVIVGGAVILALPLVLSQIFKPPKPFGVDSARNAYAKLGDDAIAQLLDIRAPVEFRQVGSPDVRGLGKKPVSIVYKGDDKPGFLKKLSLKFKEPENITLFILDKFDGNSELVAELVTVNGFKAAYAIKDGAEGPRGWMNSNLPWIPPKKALSLDLSNLTEAIGGAIGDGSDGLSVALGVAAATGLGLLAFSEVETILQLLGSAAIVQFVSKKLLFAEDRKETLQDVDEFLTTKVAPKELVDDIKQIGKALLPTTASSKALLAPTETSSERTSTNNTMQKIETPAAPIPELKVEAAAKPPSEVNSVPKEEVKAESLPGFARALSPYPYYPDFKPPTSPTPSQP